MQDPFRQRSDIDPLAQPFPILALAASPAVIGPDALRRRQPPIDRSSDRLITLAAIGLAIAFLVTGVLATLLPPALRHGMWLPLHLVLAGAATTAIAGVMPFFSAAFAAAPPIDARLRATAVGAVAVGALLVSLGVVGDGADVAVAGGLVFVTGIVLTGVATVRPLGRGLGPGRGLISKAYLAALAEVAVGAIVATLLLAGWAPAVGSWASLKPAHAWLNLVGFVSLVVATTLLHFFPTVVGARMAPRLSARLTVVGLAVGAPVVALGFALSSDMVARLGAGLTIAGSAALAVYAWRTWRLRARWTTDLGWHAFAIGGLVSAIAWLEVGIIVMAGRVMVFGSDPAGWSVEVVTGPLVVGWIGLTILASATHLVPAVGPGDQAVHWRQRRLLGRFPVLRLLAIDAGTAALGLGLPLHSGASTVVGIVLVAVG
ncbi:MAG: hypothetical protein LH650_11890, partial [Chloroflexi bacterium]|nr:hypothetical protein [Chloroflexota bacterium]